MNTSEYLCKRQIKCPSPLVSHQRPPGHMKLRENHEKDKKRSWCAGCSGQVLPSPPQLILLCVPAPGPKSKLFWRKPPLSCCDSASSRVLLKIKEDSFITAGTAVLTAVQGAPSHCRVSPGTCHLSPCPPAHMYRASYGHGHVLISAYAAD